MECVLWFFSCGSKRASRMGFLQARSWSFILDWSPEKGIFLEFDFILHCELANGFEVDRSMRFCHGAIICGLLNRPSGFRLQFFRETPEYNINALPQLTSLQHADLIQYIKPTKYYKTAIKKIRHQNGVLVWIISLARTFKLRKESIKKKKLIYEMKNLAMVWASIGGNWWQFVFCSLCYSDGFSVMRPRGPLIYRSVNRSNLRGGRRGQNKHQPHIRVSIENIANILKPHFLTYQSHYSLDSKTLPYLSDFFFK